MSHDLEKASEPLISGAKPNATCNVAVTTGPTGSAIVGSSAIIATTSGK